VRRLWVGSEPSVMNSKFGSSLQVSYYSLCCRYMHSRGWTLYWLRAVTLKAISGQLPSAAYMSDPTMERYNLRFACLSSQWVLARSVGGSSGDLAGFANLHPSVRIVV